MQISQFDTKFQEGLGPAELCVFVEKECHHPINESCIKISSYFNGQVNDELPAPTFELVQLIFLKLQDEMHHLFLKETGIIFPVIKNSLTGDWIEQKIPESIQHTQQLIINLLLKLRQLLNNFMVKPEWSKEWKDCVNELFVLECLIHQWIYIEQSLLYPAVHQKNNQVH